MKFENMKLDRIHDVIRYSADRKHWVTEKRSNHIIGIKLSGSALHKFDYKTFTIAENCIYFLNQRDNYEVDVNTRGTAFSVHFTTAQEVETDSFCIKTGNKAEIVQILERLEKLCLSDKDGLLASRYFYDLCILFDEIRNKEYHIKKDVIYSCREYMDLHFREEKCLPEAAAISGLSRRRFNDVFKNTFDITPNRYIVGKRTEYAKRLLLSGSISVSQTAEMCGFSDVYYFSKVFKEQTGFTPTQFKNGNK